MKLNDIASELRDIISKKQEELQLIFQEEDHKYRMMGKWDYPSVSNVMKKFYKEFPSDEISLRMAKGDIAKQQVILEQWSCEANYSANLGSRVHFLLEQELIIKNGSFKEVRRPIFNCDDEQIRISDSMVNGGKKYIDLMLNRNCCLVDTEMVLGDPELGYTGQPDKVWLSYTKDKSSFGIVITDWKTNKAKNFIDIYKNNRLYPPFNEYPNNALGHYYIQLPLYGKLLLKMLKGSKYENIKLLGCIIVHLNEDEGFTEFSVPNRVKQDILDLDIRNYLEVI